MAERDAFGREKGEDTLAGMGWTSSSQADAQPVPVMPMPTPLEATPGAGRAGSPGAGRNRHRAAAAAARRGGGAAAGVRAADRVPGDRRGRGGERRIAHRVGARAADDLEGAIRDAVPTAVAPPPVGLESGSLLREAALRDALAQLPDGQIESAAGGAGAHRRAGDRGRADADRAGDLGRAGDDCRRRPRPGAASPCGSNPAAPARIVRTAARRAGRDPASVSYLVLTRFGDTAEWQLFFDDGLHFSASANGKKGSPRRLNLRSTLLRISLRRAPQCAIPSVQRQTPSTS